MKNKKFPFNYLDISLTWDQARENKNYVQLAKAFHNEKIISDGANNKVEDINLKTKLFYFLHDLFLDNIFLGNNLSNITDCDIYWDKFNKKFYYSNNQNHHINLEEKKFLFSFFELNEEDIEAKLLFSIENEINSTNKIFFHPLLLNNVNNQAHEYSNNGRFLTKQTLTYLLWSIGFLILKYIMELGESELNEFATYLPLNKTFLRLKLENVDFCLLNFLENVFYYEDDSFTNLFVM